MRLSNTPVEERCELLFCVPGIMLDWCGAKLIALFPGSPCNPLLSGRAWKWDYQIDIFHDWDLSCDLSSYQGIRGIGWSLQARWDLDRTYHSSGRVCTLVVIVTHDWGTPSPLHHLPPWQNVSGALYAYYWLFIVWSHGCTCSCEHACLLSPLSPSSTSPPLLFPSPLSFFSSPFPLLFPRPLSLSSFPLLLLSTSLQSCHSLWSDVHSSCLKINIHTRVYCSNIVHTLFPSLHACMIYLQITMYTYRVYKTPHINPLWLLWLAWEYDYIHILFSTLTTPTYIFLHPSPILHIRGIAQYRLVHRVLHTSATVLQYH